MPTCAPNPEPDPVPSFFDPAEFFCHNGDYDRAAECLRAGDVYRKATLGLDNDGAAQLRAALAPHHLVMVSEGSDWVFIDSYVLGDLPTTMCRFGVHPASGPEPWCCLQRRAYMLQYRSAVTERTAFGVVYVEPDALAPAEVAARKAAGACAVCGCGGGCCQCRWCGPCSRFWGGKTDARRTAGQPHHGITAETCPGCRSR